MQRSEFLERSEFLFQCDQAQLLADAIGLTDDAPTPAPVAATNTGTLYAVAAELRRARAKFPSNRHMLAALVEEVGEVSRALLDGEGAERVRAEAIQVACVAVRIAEEGDADFGEPSAAAKQPTPGTDAWKVAGYQEELAKLRTLVRDMRDDKSACIKAHSDAIDRIREASSAQPDEPAVDAVRRIVAERDEAKAVAAQLTVRVAGLEDRVSAAGDADNRIRNLAADVERRIAEAIVNEREECAKTLGRMVSGNVFQTAERYGRANGILDGAAAIRARGTAPGKADSNA